MRQAFTLIELMIVIAIIAIIAAIAVPNLLESRVTANESAASSTLKSGIFPAQVQFQAAYNQTTDSDTVGEYGHIADLTGQRATTGQPAGQIKLLQGPLANAGAAVALKPANGHFFSCFTVNNDNSDMIMEGTALANAITDNAAETHWACTTVPERFGDTGRRVFLISQEGQVRSPIALANSNVWFTGSDPVANPVPTTVSVTTGLNDALVTDDDLTSGYDAAYPFFSR